MVKIRFTKAFKKTFSKIKDNLIKEKILKQIYKIKSNPEIGKPMRNIRKNTRELYIKPYRLSYLYSKKDDVIYLLDFYHKGNQ